VQFFNDLNKGTEFSAVIIPHPISPAILNACSRLSSA
jgi:hypothetical protein